jgi:O-methyltransferase
MFGKLARGWSYLRTNGLLQTCARTLGGSDFVDIRPLQLDMDRDDTFLRLYRACRPYTMTSKERLYALYQAVRYTTELGIAGEFVECGVWRGGSSIMACLAFEAFGDRDRRFRLYDTFQGMTAPTAHDVDVFGGNARDQMARAKPAEVTRNILAMASLADVRRNIVESGCDISRFAFVEGAVERTIPLAAQTPIALLRLDTDFYESTLHELTHLYPLLTAGGILIIDDYGYWQGARKAVDEYFSTNGPVLLNRIDRSGRLVVKSAARANSIATR